MKKIILALLCCFTGLVAFSQQQFIVKGKIEFERKTSIHKLLDAQAGTFAETMKKSLPQFRDDYFDLYFSGDKSLYKPGKEVTTMKIPESLLGPAADNIVFNDTKDKNYISQKTVFGSTFLVQDSLRKIEWKITQDTRTIAGFECRKATAIIMDSIYVVAFYTDQIITPGGPESFTGLPGMILGLALPRLSVTWFATKLEMIEVKDTDVAAPKKGKKTNFVELNNQMKASMKDYGKQGQTFIWKVLI